MVPSMVNLACGLLFNNTKFETQDSYDDLAMMCMLYFRSRWAKKHAEPDNIKSHGPVNKSYDREGGDT